ncbi:hypothetical protein R3P38DRAFT_333425 [Favolaschia claudopus]|uniref:F-box domain-containing protein n=1 Tax=Favolaschia claudopus TaxID=2862362 RepID=A0AAV9ZMH8_9AGAR
MRAQLLEANRESARLHQLEIDTLLDEAAASHTSAEGFTLYASAASLRAKASGLWRIGSAGHFPWMRSISETRDAVMRELTCVETVIQQLESRFSRVNHNTIIETDSSPALERLPPYILTEIFRWTLSPELHGHSRAISMNGGKTHVPTAPWPLTHVCQSWRTAARSDPWLWSHICVDVPLDFDSEGIDIRVAYPLPALKTQLQLSGTAPLRIKFRVVNDDLDSTIYTEHYIALLSALIEHSSRWTHLTLAWGQNAPFLDVLSRIRGKVGQLSYLCLEAEDLEDNELWPTMPSNNHNVVAPPPSPWPSELNHVFASAPRLTNIQIGKPDLLLPSDSHSSVPPYINLNLPWPIITHLHIHALSTILFQIISATRAVLIECELEESEDGDELGSVAILTLPHLLHLTCSSDCSLLPYLLAPNLQSLHLTTSGESLHLPSPIHIFLERSTCPLQTLRLHAHTDHRRNFDEAGDRFLADIPPTCKTIMHLDLDWNHRLRQFPRPAPPFGDPKFPTNVLQALTLRHHTDTDITPRLFPGLTSLRIAAPKNHVKSELLAFEEALCEMVESRWDIKPHAERSLRSVWIPPYIHSAEVRASFQALKESGLKVNDPGDSMPSVLEKKYGYGGYY